VGCTTDKEEGALIYDMALLRLRREGSRTTNLDPDRAYQALQQMGAYTLSDVSNCGNDLQ
jgi:hypothetical protein